MQAPADVNAALRRLPKVDDVLATEAARGLLRRAPRWAVVAAVRGEIDRLRTALRAAPTAEIRIDPRDLAAAVDALLQPSLQPVINATGVVLHTNLGRAPLAPAALQRVVEVAQGYANLEYRIDERRRGSRHDHVRHLLTELTGAEDALVVNNCAAAVLLVLGAHAVGREVIVSRGELVEIGGSFRVPDVMRASGAKLVEVGTTNRTHLRDYRNAITSETAILLKVHRSNFAVVGFTAEVPVSELSEIENVLTMVDLGSGAFADVHGEPTVASVIESGADVVTFSGDKLLGGPQAGIIVGSKSALEPCRTHPLLRALRPDKMTIAALEATLELYRDGKQQEIPTVAMLSAREPDLESRARKLHEMCRDARVRIEVVRAISAVGGGSLPLAEPPSWALAISHESRSSEQLEATLREWNPPIVGRIADDRLLLDVRTIREEEIAVLARAILESTW